jgi:ribosomal protein L11 methyltransferase
MSDGQTGDGRETGGGRAAPPAPATWAAIATVAGKARARALAAAVERLAPDAVGRFEVEDGSGLFEVAAYWEEGPPDGVALDLLAAAHGARPFAVSALPPTDWVAKVRRDLPPVEAGRFFLYGAHDADRVPEGRLALLVEASMAFGTGHHGTTLGCLRAIDGLAASGWAPARVADIGAGTAVLAMAAALAWPAAAVAAGDLDPVAVAVARANLRANGLAGRIACVEAEGFGHPALAGPFDLILANILKGPLLGLAGEVAARAAPGARVILSGILAEQADELAARYARLGINPRRRDRIGDWATLVFVKDGETSAETRG